VRLHDLRHFHASALLEAGVPVTVVSRRLGHASASMTLDVYGHVLPAADADAADALETMMADGSRSDQPD
jgi:integrase